ncbi:MAG: TIGR04255 family protein [Candidatus Hermodarchaeia archaeon]|jgi:uncharacterized protein (TIGR04255 family)
MGKKDDVYKNAPLVETVFEIRFPGEPALECKRDKLYEKIRNIYPKVLVPKCIEGRAIALDPYKFEKEDGTSGIMVTINKIAIFTRKYERFALFKQEAMRLFSIFHVLFKTKVSQMTKFWFL